jgi:hypothetical protein
MPDYRKALPGIRADLGQLGSNADTQWQFPVTRTSETGLRTCGLSWKRNQGEHPVYECAYCDDCENGCKHPC